MEGRGTREQRTHAQNAHAPAALQAHDVRAPSPSPCPCPHPLIPHPQHSGGRQAPHPSHVPVCRARLGASHRHMPPCCCYCCLACGCGCCCCSCPRAVFSCAAGEAPRLSVNSEGGCCEGVKQTSPGPLLGERASRAFPFFLPCPSKSTCLACCCHAHSS